MAYTPPRSAIVLRRGRGFITPAWHRYLSSLRVGVVGSAVGLGAGGGSGPGGTEGYWSPITNGDPVSPELLYDSNGDVVMGFVTL